MHKLDNVTHALIGLLLANDLNVVATSINHVSSLYYRPTRHRFHEALVLLSAVEKAFWFSFTLATRGEGKVDRGDSTSWFKIASLAAVHACDKY